MQRESSAHLTVPARVEERVLRIPCAGATLPGILSTPAGANATSGIGVVIVVGGPQYRVGSHRQFVHLARALAAEGHTVLRFDHRGMGDADGTPVGFEDAGPDLAAAIDALRDHCPQVRRVALWGLCDAASLVLMHGCSHPAVGAVVLANPWVRDDATIAAVTVKHYYRERLFQREFWAKVFSGGVDWRGSVRSLLANATRAFGGRRHSGTQVPFQTRMAQGLVSFRGPVLLLLSGRDLTAREFTEYAASAPEWRGLLDAPRVQRVELADADHTFSRMAWKAHVGDITNSWLRSAPWST